MSGPDPGALPMTRRMGLSGKALDSAACANAAKAAQNRIVASIDKGRMVPPPSCSIGLTKHVAASPARSQRRARSAVGLQRITVSFHPAGALQPIRNNPTLDCAVGPLPPRPV